MNIMVQPQKECILFQVIYLVHTSTNLFAQRRENHEISN